MNWSDWSFTKKNISKKLIQGFYEKSQNYKISAQKWASQYQKLGFLEAQLGEQKEEAESFEEEFHNKESNNASLKQFSKVKKLKLFQVNVTRQGNDSQ